MDPNEAAIPGPAPRFGLARSPSLAEQAADAIVDGIASGFFSPGQRLVEADLVGGLNMSRVPLREALKILEAQGILEGSPHRGMRVAAFTERRALQICEARIALERIALAAAAPRFAAEPALAATLDRIVTQMEAAAQAQEWMEVSRCDIRFHREIVRVSGNGIVRTLWETLARHVFILLGQEIRDERDAFVVGPQHRLLCDLLRRGDDRALHEEIARHILRLRLKPAEGGPAGQAGRA